MIRSHNLPNNRSLLAAAPTQTPQTRHRAPSHLGSTFIRVAPGHHRAGPRNLATQALLSPEDVALASDVLVQAATIAGGAAGVLRGKEVADRVKQQLALAALLLPRSTDSQRMEGTAARSAEACYDATAILATGLVGASLMHALAVALPLVHLSRF